MSIVRRFGDELVEHPEGAQGEVLRPRIQVRILGILRIRTPKSPRWIFRDEVAELGYKVSRQHPGR